MCSEYSNLAYLPLPLFFHSNSDAKLSSVLLAFPIFSVCIEAKCCDMFSVLIDIQTKSILQ